MRRSFFSDVECVIFSLKPNKIKVLFGFCLAKSIFERKQLQAILRGTKQQCNNTRTKVQQNPFKTPPKTTYFYTFLPVFPKTTQIGHFRSFSVTFLDGSKCLVTFALVIAITTKFLSYKFLNFIIMAIFQKGIRRGV